MPNGRVLPSALLFDTLLAKAWERGLAAYSEAQKLELPPELDFSGSKSVSGFYSLPSYVDDAFDPRMVEATLREHDAAVQAKLRAVADEWAKEFEGIITQAVPVGAGFTRVVQWLQRVMAGADGLGYLGQDQRNHQTQGYITQILGEVNARSLAMPTGADAALRQVSSDIMGLYARHQQTKMQADRLAEERKLLIDVVEELIDLRNKALDASMEYVFAQMHLMFDVFGRNNDYLVALKRKEQSLQAAMQSATAALAEWDARVSLAHDENADAQREAKAVNDRMLDIAQLTVEQYMKRLRRYSQRAASALNSVGVSVNSSAHESNEVDEEG